MSNDREQRDSAGASPRRAALGAIVFVLPCAALVAAGVFLEGLALAVAVGVISAVGLAAICCVLWRAGSRSRRAGAQDELKSPHQTYDSKSIHRRQQHRAGAQHLPGGEAARLNPSRDQEGNGKQGRQQHLRPPERALRRPHPRRRARAQGAAGRHQDQPRRQDQRDGQLIAVEQSEQLASEGNLCDKQRQAHQDDGQQES